MAEYSGPQEEIAIKEDWEFMEINFLEETTKRSVDNFLENIHTAVRLRRETNGRE